MTRDLARSIRLFRSFRAEQSDPDRFYADLAADSVATLAEVAPVRGALVLDVGAGPRQFADAFRAAGARYVPVDHDPGVSSVRAGGLIATAGALPVGDATVDIVFSSNLLEHVSVPEAVADELVRVLRPGGVLFLSYTNWLSPWGGHETSPWHWLGGRYAARRFERRWGRPPKNRIDETMFRVSVSQMLRWVRGREDVDVIARRPRYYPDWAAPLVRVPGVREIVTWNLLLLLRRR